jgi:hypothetical protein
MSQERYRVAQWATGHTGMETMREIIAHPRLDLVGLYVYSGDKAGRDAGEICGVEPIGVVASRQTEDILAASPDCVMFTPRWPIPQDKDRAASVDALVNEMCRLLESGANVVTTVGAFHHPPSMEPELRKRIEIACERGVTSLYDTGGAPGYITEMVPLALMMKERQLERYSIIQFADVSARNSPEYIKANYGMDPAAADPDAVRTRGATGDGASLRQLGDAINLPLDEVTVDVSFAVATKRTEIKVATIEAGTVGAWRQDVVGRRGGQPVLEFSRTVFVARDLDPAWKVRDTGWHIELKGNAPMVIDIRFPPPEIYNPVSAGYVAGPPVNSVIPVCEAKSGIRVTADLHLIPIFG